MINETIRNQDSEAQVKGKDTKNPFLKKSVFDGWGRRIIGEGHLEDQSEKSKARTAEYHRIKGEE